PRHRKTRERTSDHATVHVCKHAQLMRARDDRPARAPSIAIHVTEKRVIELQVVTGRSGNRRPRESFRLLRQDPAWRNRLDYRSRNISGNQNVPWIRITGIHDHLIVNNDGRKPSTAAVRAQVSYPHART